MTNNHLISAGQSLLAKGLAIVPVHDKRPIVKDWPTVKLDPAELASWCQTDFTTGLAVVSGRLSDNLVVLDFDGQDWRTAFDHFEYTLDLAASPKVQTGSGRRHAYIRCPDLPERATVNKFRRNGSTVELRGNRCVNVCPPSRHPSGDYYRWLDQDSDMQQFSYAELYDCLAAWGKLATDKPRDVSGQAVQATWSDPDQFKHTPAGAMRQRFKPRVQQLHPSQTYGRLPRSALEFLAIAGPVQAGDRNCHLYRVSQQFCAAGYSLEDGLNILAAPAIRSGLEPDEITNTIKSAYVGAADFEPIA